MLIRLTKSGLSSLDQHLDHLQEPDPELRDTAQQALDKFVALLADVTPRELFVEPIVTEDL
jgi:hypothetical protein